MKDDRWLFGTIFEIKKYEDDGIFAAVAEDTDDDHALCVEFRRHGEPIFGTHFNINWLEKDKQDVAWLAGVVGRIIRDAYAAGAKAERNRIYGKLGGLYALLKEVSDEKEDRG